MSDNFPTLITERISIHSQYGGRTMSKAYGMNFPTTEGMKLAQDWCPSRAVLASDSVTLVALLQMQGGPCSRLKFIVNEAKLAGEGLPEWTVVHTKRESNWVAHELAQLAKRTRHSTVLLRIVKMFMSNKISLFLAKKKVWT